MPSRDTDDAGRLCQFWTKLVTDATPSHLPSSVSSSKKSAINSSRLGRWDIRIELALINACCQRWGLSPMDIVQAAWAATVRLYCGTDDVMFIGIGTEYPSIKQKWINTSLCRTKLEMNSSLISALERTHNGGLLEADSMVSVLEALDIFSALDPKPCNSAIMLQDPLVKEKLSENDIVNDKNVSQLNKYYWTANITDATLNGSVIMSSKSTLLLLP